MSSRPRAGRALGLARSLVAWAALATAGTAGSHRAQLAFLCGDAGGKTRDLKLAHPFYWAPYMLMENWL